MYHHHSQQEGPPQTFSNRPRPFNHQEQAHQQQQQQQQQHNSHFQYPPIKGSRNTDMEPMNMDIDVYSERMNGSRSGGFSSSPQPLSESQPGHKRVVLERVALDSSDYRHPDQMFSSSTSTATQQPQSSHSAMDMQAWMQAWMHEPPSPQTRGSHSGVGDGQGVPESAGSILASFGLSSQDLKVLSQYPEDQLTPDNLPYIIQDILSRKSNDQNIAASSSSSYSQSATHTVCETQPPPSCSHGSLGRRRSPEVSSMCIDYGHSSRTTIDYGHSSLPTIVSSSREAFIREPLSCESLSDTERKKLKRPPASSLPKQEMDVVPERWQFCPQPPVPNKHGDLDYRKSSSTFHKSKRSPTAECPLPPRSRHPDLDYRRDSSKRSPSSEKQSDYSSSSRRPAPWSSLSKPRDDTKRLPTPSVICDYSAESTKDWIDHVESVKHTESYRDLHNKRHKSKRSPTPERLLPPRSRLPDPDYRRDSPKRSSSSETQRGYSSSSRRPAPWSSLSKPRDDTKRLPTPSICDYSAEFPKDWIDHVESVKHTESYRDLHNKRHKSKRSPTPERLLPPRSRHPDPDYRRDSPKRSPSSETQRDYSSSSRRPAPWSSLSKPRDDTKRLPTPSMICDDSAESPKDWIDHVESVKHTESYRDLHNKRHKSKRSPTPERLLPPRSRHPDPDYRRDSPKRSPSSETQRDYSSSSRRPAPWSSLSKPRDDTKRLPTPSICDDSAESPKDWIDHVESVKHTESYRDLHNKRNKSKRSPTAECLLPPRSRHPDPDYRRDSPKRSPSSETQRDYSSSSRHPAPWSSLSKPRDDTKRLPTPSICDDSAESPKCGGEEPPQLAQDKARLEEEYLSLMAELGEEPVPSSGGGGGHNDNQGGGGGNDNNNQPPPVEEDRFQDFPDLRDFVTVDEVVDEVGDANNFPNSPPPTDAVAMDTTVTVDQVEEDRFRDFPDLRDFVTVDEVVDEVGDANDFPNSPPTDAVAMDTTVTVDKGSAAPVDLVSFEPLPSLMDIPTAPTTKLKDILKDPDYPVILYWKGKVSGYRCKLCNIKVKTTDVAQPGNHYKGKKHKVNAFLRLRLSKEENISAEPDGTIHTSQDERVEEVSTIHTSQDERVEEVSTIHTSQDEHVEEVSTIHTSQDEHVEEVSTIHASQDEHVEEVSTIHASQDEHVEEVSSGLCCKLCQCFLPKGAAAIKAHLTGKRHAKRLRQLDQERKPKAPRREQQSLGQDDIPTTRERSATPDDDSVTHKPPPSSTELKHISEGSPDDGKDTAEEEDFIPEDPDYPEILYTYSTVIVYHCKLCDVRVETTNEADLDRHVNGKQHSVKSLRSLYLVKNGDNLEDICRDQSIVAVDKNQCSPYHCKLCDIRMENATRLRDHMYGRKHNVLLIQSQSLRSLYLDKNTVNLEDICRAESIAVDHKNPFTVSRCEMCKIFPKQGTKQGVYEHLNGQQHVTSLWNKMKRSFRKDQTAPRFSAHLEERHLRELYLEIEANLGKKYNRNAERDAMIYTSQDEHVEEHVSSKGKVSLQCKLCQCFLPKGAPINAHLTGKRHAVSLRQLEERRKEESLAEFEELHTRSFQLKCYFDAMELKEGKADQNSSMDEAAGKELSGSHSQAEVEETENVEQMEEDEEEKTAASVSVKRLMSEDKRTEEEPMQKKQKTHDNPPPPFDPNSADDEISPE